MPRLLGLRFGRLKIVARTGTPVRGADGRRTAVWCRCDCGNEKITFLTYLTKGHNRSCGCIPTYRVCGPAHPSYKHGHSHSRTMNSFESMRARCCHKHHRAWKDYGGRGIRICKRWTGKRGFLNFLADMGKRPEGKSLDRIRVNGNYTPANCKWSTRSQQSTNQRPRSSKPLAFDYDPTVEEF